MWRGELRSKEEEEEELGFAGAAVGGNEWWLVDYFFMWRVGIGGWEA